MTRRPHAFTLSWLDMLYSQMAMFAFLFLVAYALIKPADSKPGVEMKAEYLVSMTWPDGSLDDIDLHLLLPDQRMVNFKTREVGYALLDHDDMGTNGFYVAPDGKTVRVAGHKEIISIRAVVPGTYVANVHVFRINEVWVTGRSEMMLPYKVHVTLTRLNPRVEEIAAVDVEMAQVGQQKTAFAFTVEEGGKVTIDGAADMPFIPTVPKEFRSDR